MVWVCGGSDCTFILRSGNVWACGGNSKGQLCGKDMKYSASTTFFSKIEGLPCIKSIACFDQHVLCVDINGDLWTFGNNHNNQLGFQEPKKCCVPTQVQGIRNVSAVSTYKNASVCVSDGKIFYTRKEGFVEYCSSGVAKLDEIHFCDDCCVGLAFISDTFEGPINQNSNRAAIVFPYMFEPKRQAFVITKDVKNISAHNNNIVLISSSGSVLACGKTSRCLVDEDFGHEFGAGSSVLRSPPIGIKLPNCLQISCGENHILFLDEDGICWALGENSYGQLGVGDNDNRTEPTRVLCDERVTQIYAASNHSILIDEYENIWIFGANSYGQLGLHHKDNVHTPTKVSLTPSQKSATSA